MSKKVKSFDANVKNVEELIKSSPELKDKIPLDVLKSIPPELLKDVEKTMGDFLGGDGLANYLKQFMGIFETIAVNVEMNTKGVSVLANNMKFLRNDIKIMGKDINYLIHLIKEKK